MLTTTEMYVCASCQLSPSSFNQVPKITLFAFATSSSSCSAELLYLFPLPKFCHYIPLSITSIGILTLICYTIASLSPHVLDLSKTYVPYFHRWACHLQWGLKLVGIGFQYAWCAQPMEHKIPQEVRHDILAPETIQDICYAMFCSQ